MLVEGFSFSTSLVSVVICCVVLVEVGCAFSTLNVLPSKASHSLVIRLVNSFVSPTLIVMFKSVFIFVNFYLLN